MRQVAQRNEGEFLTLQIPAFRPLASCGLPLLMMDDRFRAASRTASLRVVLRDREPQGEPCLAHPCAGEPNRNAPSS